jgi:hypothetical protein
MKKKKISKLFLIYNKLKDNFFIFLFFFKKFSFFFITLNSVEQVKFIINIHKIFFEKKAKKKYFFFFFFPLKKEKKLKKTKKCKI